jgi:S-adenosyl-L-methionine hydrolase (adenosine-forming)
MARQRIATLLTDFGTRDPYVAEMKGTILQICPEATLVDVTHDIAPHDVLGAAFTLAQVAPRFPQGTVHVVVVDPGVGTHRAILALQYGGQRFICPDNGVITFIAQRFDIESLFSVQNARYFAPDEASQTFQGRDIFAPAAAHLLNGIPISRLGEQPAKPMLLDIPQPEGDERSIRGEIIYVDRFGNLISNIPESMLRQRWPRLEAMTVTCGGKETGPLRPAYGYAGDEAPMSLINSMKLLEVAVNCQRACDVFGAGIGAPILVTDAGRE